jgi:DNA-binding FadR family transcriptional regulator
VLSLKDAAEMEHLLSDHRNLLDALIGGDAQKAEGALRTHLSRIERTLEAVEIAHPDYFER